MLAPSSLPFVHSPLRFQAFFPAPRSHPLRPLPPNRTDLGPRSSRPFFSARADSPAAFFRFSSMMAFSQRLPFPPSMAMAALPRCLFSICRVFIGTTLPFPRAPTSRLSACFVWAFLFPPFVDIVSAVHLLPATGLLGSSQDLLLLSEPVFSLPHSA